MNKLKMSISAFRLGARIGFKTFVGLRVGNPLSERQTIVTRVRQHAALQIILGKNK